MIVNLQVFIIKVDRAMLCFLSMQSIRFTIIAGGFC